MATKDDDLVRRALLAAAKEIVKILEAGPKPAAKKEAGGKNGGKKAAAPAKGPEPAVDYDEVKKAFSALLRTKGKEAVEEIFTELFVGKLSELEPAQYAGALEKAKAALEPEEEL